MLCNQPRSDKQSRLDTRSLFPVEVHEWVSEVSQQSRDLAEHHIWRELQHKEGVVWHRQADPSLQGLSRSIEASNFPVRPPETPTFSHVQSTTAMKGALLNTVGNSPLVTNGVISAEQRVALENEFREMYRLVCALTGKSDAAIDLRVEREKAYIENFHQDYGTALLMTLSGPGPQFIQPANVPTGHDGFFFRQELPRPDDVYQVPPLSLLAMRGKPDDGSYEAGSPQGLWHSSPPKLWNNTPQWDLRVLLIVTSPHSEILPPRPNIQG